MGIGNNSVWVKVNCEGTYDGMQLDIVYKKTSNNSMIHMNFDRRRLDMTVFLS